MKRGLYYNSPEKITEEDISQYLGTFYYLEPDSTTWLTYKTAYRSFNKYTAYVELRERIRTLLREESAEQVVDPVLRGKSVQILTNDCELHMEYVYMMASHFSSNFQVSPQFDVYRSRSCSSS